MTTRIQSIIVKQEVPKKQREKIVKEIGELKKVDHTKSGNYRYRQYDPDYKKEIYRLKRINSNISLIIGIKKK